MAFPTAGWPPPCPSGVRSLRFHYEGVATDKFSDNAFLFYGQSYSGRAEGVIATPAIQDGVPGTPTRQAPTPPDPAPMQALNCGTDLFVAGGLPDGTKIFYTDPPQRSACCSNLRILSKGSKLMEFSFSATSDAASQPIHGIVTPGECNWRPKTYECGVAIRCRTPGDTCAFVLEAW
jgi:hypothetical protein